MMEPDHTKKINSKVNLLGFSGASKILLSLFMVTKYIVMEITRTAIFIRSEQKQFIAVAIGENTDQQRQPLLIHILLKMG